MTDDLVRKAEEAATRSYSPYSKYAVGAVLRTNDGREFAGVNVENAAFPLTQCAETTAIGMAAAAGYRPGDIAAIGVNASPCGACRQWIYEWRIPEVSFRRDDGTIAHYRAEELLPDTWNLPSTE